MLKPARPPGQGDVPPPKIVLATLNARYSHTSLGLRYLLANLGELRPAAMLREYTTARDPAWIAGDLIDCMYGGSHQAEASLDRQLIIGLGVYIWNVTETTEVVRRLKERHPEIIIVAGGPEVSYETDEQEICRLCDHTITGWGELSFAKLCADYAAGNPPAAKIIEGRRPPLPDIALPYREYTDADIANRVIYVEASRGCPFKCSFCLSSLDKSAWPFDLDLFMAELDLLYTRGVRSFKFVDRTFNLRLESSVRILNFFLQRIERSPDLSLHFEVVPDHFPKALCELIEKFPAGSIQLEVGIQTFTEPVQRLINRKQDNLASDAKLRWLRAESRVHLHTDLVFGLPGETMQSFAESFNRLYALRPHEIQLGILKRLRGAPIRELTAEYGMDYDDKPPYQLIRSKTISLADVERVQRFSRYWEIVANSGRFIETSQLILNHPKLADDGGSNSPFHNFLDFSDWMWGRFAKTHGFTPESIVDCCADYLTTVVALGQHLLEPSLLNDYQSSGARGTSSWLRGKQAKPTTSPGKTRPRQRQQRFRESS